MTVRRSVAKLNGTKLVRALARILSGALLAASPPVMAADGSVPPESSWTCPRSHPVKGNFTTYTGEPCIYHLPGGGFYSKTKPERCYASEREARADGCRKSLR